MMVTSIKKNNLLISIQSQNSLTRTAYLSIKPIYSNRLDIMQFIYPELDLNKRRLLCHYYLKKYKNSIALIKSA
jgi:hypothetical protein